MHLAENENETPETVMMIYCTITYICLCVWRERTHARSDVAEASGMACRFNKERLED